jgi:hypothetical protein
MAYFVVLTENATEGAAGEKDRARAALSDQGGFLSEMGMMGRHHSLPAGAAEALFPGQAVHSATPWAEVAAGELFTGRIPPAKQFAGGVKGKIAWRTRHMKHPLQTDSFSGLEACPQPQTTLRQKNIPAPPEEKPSLPQRDGPKPSCRQAAFFHGCLTHSGHSIIIAWLCAMPSKKILRIP